MGNHNLKSIIKEGTVENVDEYLKECPDMKNHVFRYGWTPCHLAVEYHKLDVLKYLIETAAADIKHVDNAGSNLLHHALHFADHHFDIVKYLLETGVFKFDDSKDEHQNTTLHLAFKYCTLKEIAELNKYYKGLKELFQEKNDHGLTPLAILRERVKHSEESLDIVRQLQEEIEKEGEATPAGTPSTRRSTDKKSPSGSGRSSPELKHSDGGEKAGSKRTKKGKSSDDEEKEENKKHSDEDKKKHGSKHSKHHEKKHSDDKHDVEHDKKHSDEDKKKHGSKHQKHDDEHDKKHGSKHHKHDDEHDKKHGSKHQKHDEHEVEGKKHSHKKKHSGEGSD